MRRRLQVGLRLHAFACCASKLVLGGTPLEAQIPVSQLSLSLSLSLFARRLEQREGRSYVWVRKGWTH